MTSTASAKKSSQFHNDGETLLSRKLIEREFKAAGCLVTIGLDHIIIGPEFIARFQQLMEALRELEKSGLEEPSRKPLLAWVIDAGETVQENQKSRDKFRKLQECLQKLDKETAEWLAECAVFVVAHADKNWIEQSVLADRFPLDDYHASEVSDADKFFDSIRQHKKDEWRTADVITAFPRVKNRKATKFYRHDLPDDRESLEGRPLARKLDSNKKKRDSLVRRLCRLDPSEFEKDFDPETLSKFFNRGFAIFKLEEVIKIEI